MATWSKLFSFFTWKNRPDTSTPLGQTLLNRLNTALNGIDDRVITLNSQMVSSDQMGSSITNVRLDEKTGIFTFTRYDGTTFTINTALEEVVTNFKYDNATQQLVLTLSDGTTQDVDLSDLITQYEFTNSATILWTITDEGKVVGNIKPNSITDQMLQTNYLADITTQANTALSASQSALESQFLAEQSAEEAKEQADRAEAAADRAESVSAVDIATTEKAGIVKPDGTTITVDADGTIHGNASVTVDDVLSTESTNPIANKAVAEEFVECFKKSGGDISGAVQIFSHLYVRTSEEKSIQQNLINPKRSLYHEIDANGNYVFYDRTNGDRIMHSTADGTNTFNGTASGNLPLTGGEVSGNTTFKVSSYQGFKVVNTTSETSAFIAYYNKNEELLGRLGFNPSETPEFCANDGTHHKLLHTGNKPSGTYTGNGSSTARTISTGGIGKVLYVSRSSYSGIVFGAGGILLKNDGTITGLSYNQAHFDNGKLVIATDGVLNTNGVEITYVVV